MKIPHYISKDKIQNTVATSSAIETGESSSSIKAKLDNLESNYMADNCPNCGVTWVDGKTICERFIEDGYSPEKAREKALHYGDKENDPKHFKINKVLRNFPGSRYKETICKNCDSVFEGMI